jgi:hypothetical protein
VCLDVAWSDHMDPGESRLVYRGAGTVTVRFRQKTELTLKVGTRLQELNHAIDQLVDVQTENKTAK